MPFDAVNRLSRAGVRRGILGGSNAWAMVALITGLIRLSRRLNRPRTIWSGKLEPGQRLVIDSRPAPKRRSSTTRTGEP